MNRRQCE